MDSHLIALKLVFDGVQTEVDVSTLEARKLLQKVVYLVQRSGLDLSYRFAWDEMGPYCRDLAQDNRELARNVELDDLSWEGYELQDRFDSALESVRGLIARKPVERDLATHDWLELLASIDYLVYVNGLTVEEAKTSLDDVKRHLMHDYPAALEALRAAKLVAA